MPRLTHVPLTDRQAMRDSTSQAWPIKALADQNEQGRHRRFTQAVGSRLIFSLNEIAYLKKVDIEAFQQIVDQIAERSQNGSTIRTLSRLAGLWDN